MQLQYAPQNMKPCVKQVFFEEEIKRVFDNLTLKEKYRRRNNQFRM